MSRILIVEDDPTLGGLLAEHLRAGGHDATLAAEGQRGLDLALDAAPDLLILDVMLPGLDGWELLRRLRATSALPVLMLTARADQEDLLRGLALGADDYVRKPFDLRELDLRIAGLLRRASAAGAPPAEPGVYDDGVLLVDIPRRLVARRGRPIHLTPTEFRLLAHLAANAGRPISHADLLAAAWGPEYADDASVLAVYIRYLREKLEDDAAHPAYIVTEWGVGYRFVKREA
jgi:two-component system KDP operon response regulator KdpE